MPASEQVVAFVFRRDWSQIAVRIDEETEEDTLFFL